MGNRSLLVRSLLVVLATAGATRAEAPKVVKTTPTDGAEAVDPNSREIRVEFDRPMDRGGFSFVGGGESFPETVGRPRWIGETTCVLSVRLRPDHAYQVGINSDRFRNFRGVDGVPAVPVAIRFRTGPAGAAVPPTPDDFRRAFGELRRAIDEDYAYRDRLGVDWPSRFREAESRLVGAKTPEAFAGEVVSLLAPAKDLHLWVKLGVRVIPTSTRSVRPNFDLATLSRVVPGWTRRGEVAVGRFDDQVAYVLIGSWGPEVADDLEAAYAALAGARAMIVDVRPNGGGDEALARRFAGCFVDEPKVYARHVVRSGGKDSPPSPRSVEPNRARPKFRGRTVVLMGPYIASTDESFLQMMDQVEGCTLVGSRTTGSSGNPRPVDLGLGIVLYVPSWRDFQVDGKPVEGRGIDPDVEVRTIPADFNDRDPVLDAALAILRKP